MKIRRIIVGNYKNIGMTTLDCSRMIALVSVNNYGKSNLLESIQFGLDFITDAEKDRRAKMCWSKAIPLTVDLAGKPFSFTIEFDEPLLGEYRFVRYGFSFAWYDDEGSGARIVDEKLELRSSESVKYTSYLKRAEGKYRASKSTSAFRSLELSGETLAIDAIGLIKDVEIGEAVRAIKQIKYRVCDSLELDGSFRSEPVEIGAEDAFQPGKEDIPRTLAMLKKKQTGLYQLFEETVYDLFPEFTHIELETFASEMDYSRNRLRETALSSPDTYQADVRIPFRNRNEVYRLMIDSRHRNQPMSMDQMSMGTKRVFWLITNAVMASSRGLSLLGIDEIESSIHPRMIRGLLESMNEILENETLIVTSHSPYLIQYLKPESIYIGVPNQNGTAVFQKIQPGKVKGLIKTVRRLDLTLGEYLFDLMSGDEDSADILSSYLEG